MLKLTFLFILAAVSLSACAETPASNSNKSVSFATGDTVYIGSNGGRAFVAMDEDALAKFNAANASKDSSSINSLINEGKVMVVKNKNKARIIKAGAASQIQMLDGDLQGLKLWAADKMLRAE